MPDKNKVMYLFPKWAEDYGWITHFVNRSSAWPPLNLAYLAGISEEMGFESRIMDGQGQNISLEEMIEKTLDFNPGIVGITSTTPFHHFSEKVARRIKKESPETLLVVGGPHITVTHDDPTQLGSFDLGFVGQADSSWREFLRKYEKNENFMDVPGITFNDKDGKAFYTGQALPVDMKEEPFPARHLLDMSVYKLGTQEGYNNFTSIKSVRGCPFKCTFCSTDVFGYKLRRNDPEHTGDEIERCIEEFGIRHYVFLDDTLTANKKHISAVADEIINRNLDITFEGSTRANLIDEPTMEKLVEAGLIRLSFGLETVNETIRKLMRKEVPLEAHDVANELCNKYSVEALNSCMIGMPGETKESIRETLAYLRQTPKIKQVNISIAVPYPGTELAKQAESGEFGLEILADSYSDFRRYNAAVMRVGDLMPEDLVRLQNDAYLSIYSHPARWQPMYKKQGMMGVLLTLKRAYDALIGEHRIPDFITNNQLKVNGKNKKENLLGKIVEKPASKASSLEQATAQINT